MSKSLNILVEVTLKDIGKDKNDLFIANLN